MRNAKRALVSLSLIAFAPLLLPWRGWERWISSIHWLRVEEVRVACEMPLTEERVLSWLPALKGRNILLVQASALMKQLRVKPWVDSVVIKKEYPNRIFIEVTARRARALRIAHGVPIIVDNYGREIDKATPEMIRSMDLPVVAAENDLVEDQWDLSEVIRVMESSQRALGRGLPISQVFLSAYPYFRFYLSDPATELQFSLETWESQLPRAVLLLQHPPREIAQPRKINLVLAKKAVVSSLLSN
jgi:hypothetical protein